MSFITDLFSGGASTLVNSVGNVLDKVVTTKEEKMQLENELVKSEQQFQVDMQKLQADLDAAAKARDQIKLTVMRLLKSALKNAEIELGHELTPPEMMSVLQKEAKKRRESIAQYSKAERQDLVDEEQAELKIIDEYLPAKLTEAELEKVVEDTITKLGATSQADMGKVMQAVMAEVGVGADGSQVSALVKAKLA